MLDSLRDWIDAFLTALEEERYQVDLAQRRRPQLGALYGANGLLFAVDRITEVQRALAGASGAEERRIRALFDFLGRGRAMCASGAALDARLTWEIFGSVELGESRIPHRQIPAALGLAGEPERRRAIEDAHLRTLDEQCDLAEDFLARHRDGIAELGYGSHVEGLQVLGSIDLHAVVRDGERFLADTRDAYLELLQWHLPRFVGVEVGAATSADGRRLEAAIEYDPLLAGGDRNRAVLEAIRETGLDPVAEGRIRVEWEAYLGVTAGAVCRPRRVPDDVLLAVSTRSGRPAVATFLHAYGLALHHAYTAADLPVEQRRLGDESAVAASGYLFEGLLRNASFLARVSGFPRAKVDDYRRLERLCGHLAVRRDIARLQYALAMYGPGASPEAYETLMYEATALRHDARMAIWDVDVEFAPARRLRGMQLAAMQGHAVRNRFDEDWFRNPRAGAYLANAFSDGRRYSAPELAIQLGASRLGFDALLAELAD